MPIEKCTTLIEGVKCGLAGEEESPGEAELLCVLMSLGYRSSSIYRKSAGSATNRIGFEIIEFRKKIV